MTFSYSENRVLNPFHCRFSASAQVTIPKLLVPLSAAYVFLRTELLKD
ncbi:hypothetical protein S7335_480 [Synechococcus sp. PCC 7335]|nr:hypothetical protein S7335_480 [Synechococcus sp. PCC 7335]